MIAYVRGEIEDIAGDNVVIDVGQAGLNVKISAGTASLLPGVGQVVKLYTYTCVREDAFCLYGFLSRDDLNVFKQLITVSGIGPKGGLAVLSVMSADDLRFAVLSGDVGAIARAPGIGKKTAERIILDLKDKISMEDTLIQREAADYAEETGTGGNGAAKEAVQALTALGYSLQDASKAVNQVAAEGMEVEAILKEALRKMY